ncbi:SPX domain-containing protein [Sordaria brevicollis]|uniref:SPX domain-containing protein n=1 Tax=Sordaria brevicollis TaxID=83679 RepID=A0AAE0U599_SORBR|nr:SPX domain-containing protein [Sordaria brevicollis]
MKFGHSFKEALQGETYPQHWVDKAIPYGQLKKLLGKVREELSRNGYDPDTLHRLLADHNAEYRLRLENSHILRPKLVVRPSASTICLRSDAAPKLITAGEPSTPANAPTKAYSELSPSLSSVPQEHTTPSPKTLAQAQDAGWVDIPLDSDAKFFNILQTDVVELDSLQTQERQSMNDGIHLLGDEIARLARPRKGVIQFAKSDLYRWREIFELYLAAQIFFSTAETATGPRDSEKARKQLVWFQDEVSKRQLLQKFKLKASAEAYTRFLELNATLLKNYKFQELNRTAVTKIIKKFDKQTSLGIKAEFPKAMSSAPFIAGSIAKDICSQLACEVLSRVPQIVDYTCTICYSICWLPVRLDCDHMFCIRCMIKMQNRNKELCPLCRAKTVLSATEAHIDWKLMSYMEKWFPKETKEKQRYNELERRRELLGEAYVDTNDGPCIVM